MMDTARADLFARLTGGQLAILRALQTDKHHGTRLPNEEANQWYEELFFDAFELLAVKFWSDKKHLELFQMLRLSGHNLDDARQWLVELHADIIGSVLENGPWEREV